MNAIKVDETHRVRLTMLVPGDYYVPEALGENSVMLHKVPPPPRQRSKAEVLMALEESPIRFTGSWEDLKNEVR